MQKLEKIINWANSKDEIRALILSGSLTAKGKKDELSDYDIAVFGTDFYFINNDNWLNEIKKLPDDYNIGYKILLDKDGVLEEIRKPSFKGFIVEKPNEKAFQENVNEFWFECYHVAKYLYRNDLWTAKSRDWATKELLRQMLEWQEASKREWNFSPKNCGKEMQTWLNEYDWQNLQYCFGKFDKQDSWQALLNTITLYKKAATEIADNLKYEYNQKLEANISQFIEELKNRT